PEELSEEPHQARAARPIGRLEGMPIAIRSLKLPAERLRRVPERHSSGHGAAAVLLAGGDGEDALRSEVEINGDLDHAARARAQTGEGEGAQVLALAHLFALPLDHDQLELGLSVLGGGEVVLLADGEGG